MRLALLWMASVIVSLGVLAWAGRAAILTRADARDAQAGFGRAATLAQEVIRLRAAAPVEEAAAPAPASTLPTHLTAALSRCGLPANCLSTFSAQPSSRHPASGRTIQRATFVLGSLTLPQLGRFLGSWREAQPDWCAISIELTPAGRAPSPGGDLPIQAVVALESSHHAESKEGPR